MTPLPSIFRRKKKKKNFLVSVDLKFDGVFPDDDKNDIFTVYIHDLSSTLAVLESMRNVLNTRRQLNHDSEVHIKEIGFVKLTDCLFLGLPNGEKISRKFCQLLDPLILLTEQKIKQVKKLIRLEEKIISRT